MFIKKCDFISPKMTLYFKGEKVHYSIFSGIVTIVAYLLIFGFVIYYLVRFIIKKDLTTYYYNKYANEVQSFPLNYSSIFHYIQLFNKKGNQQNLEINYNYARIIGLDRGIETYKELYNLSLHNHWIYGPCDYETDAGGLTHLIDIDIFSGSACIKQYYDFNLKKFFNKNEEGFIWPIIKNEFSNSNKPDRSSYGIIIEKCHNDSLKNDCGPKEEIEKYFKNYSFNLNILDQYADILNYKNPLVKYLTTVISGGPNEGESASLNNLNFNPIIVKTHSGIIFEKIIEEKGFVFIQNDKMMMDSRNKNIIFAFYFFMQNNIMYNERHYKKFPDLFSELGGLGSFILLVASFINFVVTQYTILLDTQEIMLSINKVHLNKRIDFNKMPYFYRKAS